MYAHFAPVVDTWIWRGRSGTAYRHYVYPIDAMPAVRSAVYVLVRLDPGRGYRPIYVGQFGGEDGGRAARPSRTLLGGATHVHLNVDGKSAEDRDAIMEDLRAALTPHANELRSAG